MIEPESDDDEEEWITKTFYDLDELTELMLAVNGENVNQDEGLGISVDVLNFLCETIWSEFVAYNSNLTSIDTNKITVYDKDLPDIIRASENNN